jgi:hypothetical protein
MHIYTHTGHRFSIYERDLLYIYTYIHTYIHTQVVDSLIWESSAEDVWVRVIEIHTHLHIHTYVYIHMYICIYIYTYTYICIGGCLA